MNNKIINYIYYTLIIFSLTTLFQGFSLFSWINKSLIIILFLEILCSFKSFKYRKNDFLIIILTVFLHSIAFICTGFVKLYNFNVIFYLLIWVIIYLLLANKISDISLFINNNHSFLKRFLIIWNLIVFVSIFIKSCYNINGEFGSFSGTGFRLAPAALIIIALTMHVFKDCRFRTKMIMFLVPSYSIFMCGSRTYFGVYLLIMLSYLYIEFKNKRLFYLSLGPLLLLVVVLLSFSSIGRKIERVSYKDSSYFDYLGTITNGRTVFWKWDLDAFLNLSIPHQLVGNGYNFVYEVNEQHMTAIWAHNDFINILMNFGYLGLLVYFYSFFRMSFAFFKNTKCPILVKILFYSAVFINSMFNMSYTYLCAVISYPIFLQFYYNKYNLLKEDN